MPTIVGIRSKATPADLREAGQALRKLASEIESGLMPNFQIDRKPILNEETNERSVLWEIWAEGPRR